MENSITTPKQPFMSPSTLSTHKHSHTISKMKPNIRIIHMFAPEIIKTDAANFRELVQRLTGKPTGRDHDQKGCERKLVKNPSREDEEGQNQKKVVETTKGFLGFGMLKEEEEDGEMVWKNNGGNRGGFLGGFSEVECNYGFFQELGEEFPLLSHHNQMHGFEETQLA